MRNSESSRAVVPFSSAVSRVFDDFWRDSYMGMPVMNARPSVDVIEHDSQIIVKADMPGLEKKDIKVTVHDGLLHIEGNRSETYEEKGNGFVRSERYSGSFARSFNLPTWADGSKVAADYKDGILTVTIPKSAEARPREVEVKVS